MMEKKKKDWNKIMLIVLLICTILCFLLGVVLYIIGIRRILPVVLIFFLAFLLSLAILLLSRDAILMKTSSRRKVIIRKNA